MTRIHPLRYNSGQAEVPRRTEAIFKFIKTFHAAHGYAPTRMEIGKACHPSRASGRSLSTSMVNYYLDALQDAGRLTVARNVARGIVLAEKDEWARLGMTSDGALK